MFYNSQPLMNQENIDYSNMPNIPYGNNPNFCNENSEIFQKINMSFSRQSVLDLSDISANNRRSFQPAISPYNSSFVSFYSMPQNESQESNQINQSNTSHRETFSSKLRPSSSSAPSGPARSIETNRSSGRARCT